MKEEEIIWMLKTEFFKDVGNYDATVTEYANWLQTKLVGIISRSSDIINLLTSRPVVDDIDEDEQQMVEMLDNFLISKNYGKKNDRKR